MRGFFEWRVRRGHGLRRFSDGLVVQGGRRGELELWACRSLKGSPPAGALAFLVPMLATCASEGIRRDTGLVTWLHWPDLVVLDGRVLAETELTSRRAGESLELVFHVRVNCFARSAPREASLRDVLGVEVDLDLLRDRILQALDWYYAEWGKGERQKLVRRMRTNLAWLGREVEVRSSEKTVAGRAVGLDERGSLLLERGEAGKGRTVALSPEGVELVRERG